MQRGNRILYNRDAAGKVHSGGIFMQANRRFVCSKLCSLYHKMITVYCKVNSVYPKVIGLYCKVIADCYKVIRLYYKVIGVYSKLIRVYSKVIAVYYKVISDCYKVNRLYYKVIADWRWFAADYFSNMGSDGQFISAGHERMVAPSLRNKDPVGGLEVRSTAFAVRMIARYAAAVRERSQTIRRTFYNN